MTRPRSQLVCVEETPYYHVMSRCVRRTFLCGVDKYTGQDYEHRRLWIEQRIHILSSIFAIDIASYAVMSNHYHIVLKLCPEQLSDLSDKVIAMRWMQLYQGPEAIHHFVDDKYLSDSEHVKVTEIIKEWRSRLASLSWFMRCLNEPIARQANQEDQCTGHFWEARYKSQSLKSEQALMACMAYVDLNPVRAKMAKTPEASDHTSIKQRIKPSLDSQQSAEQQIIQGDLLALYSPIKPLMPFYETSAPNNHQALPFTWNEYLNLVDWTGRILRDDKRGAIDDNLPPILDRLNIQTNQWLSHSSQFERFHPKVFNREKSVFVSIAD